jgi:uncharacterized protein (DUF2141 family)
MKYITTAICLGMVLAASRAADLTIEVRDVKTDKGPVMIALYNSAAGFLKQPTGVMAAPATGATVSMIFKDVPAGDYAFAAFQDANRNGVLDRNLIGMPTEEYAFSNNAYGHMGPPAFDAAKVALPAAGASASITLR